MVFRWFRSLLFIVCELVFGWLPAWAGKSRRKIGLMMEVFAVCFHQAAPQQYHCEIWHTLLALRVRVGVPGSLGRAGILNREVREEHHRDHDDESEFAGSGSSA